MNFVFPRQKNRVIATPLHILWYSFRLRLILAEFVLEITSNHPDLTVFRVKGHKLTVRGNADMHERAIGKYPVLSLGRINDIYRLPNRK